MLYSIIGKEEEEEEKKEEKDEDGENNIIYIYFKLDFFYSLFRVI